MGTMDHTFDRSSLGAFLRTRRAALQPEDVGLRRGPRRRAPGLRREEVAELCTMSADYFARLERGDGPQPSEQMVTAIARGLRLTPDERDHLFLLAGYRTARRDLRLQHVSPGLMRVMDGLAGTTAQVMGPLGETLLQTPSAVALLGDQTQYTGNYRSATYRWFTDPAERERYHPKEHDNNSRINVALLRAAVTRNGPDSPQRTWRTSCSAPATSSHDGGSATRWASGGARPNGSFIPRSDNWSSTANSCSTRTRASHCSYSPPRRGRRATSDSPCSPCWAPTISSPTPSDDTRGLGGTRCSRVSRTKAGGPSPRHRFRCAGPQRFGSPPPGPSSAVRSFSILFSMI